MQPSGLKLKTIFILSGSLFFFACVSGGDVAPGPEVIPNYHRNGEEGQGESASQVSAEEDDLPEPEVSGPDLSGLMAQPGEGERPLSEVDFQVEEHVLPLPDEAEDNFTMPADPPVAPSPTPETKLPAGTVSPPVIPTPAPEPLPSPTPLLTRTFSTNTPRPVIARVSTPRPAVRTTATPRPTATVTPAGDLVKQTELFCKPGDEIQIILPDAGWLFTGFESANSRSGIAFLGNEPVGQESGFLFKTRAVGDYLLKFLLQDHSQGTAQQEHYFVRVVEEETLYSRLHAETPTPEVPESLPALQTGRGGDEYYRQGDYIQALGEYLKDYDPENAYVNDRIAGIYEGLAELDAAVKYWQRNLNAPPPFSTNATAGLVRTAVKTDDLETVLANIEGISLGNALTERELIDVAAYLAGKEKLGLSLGLLDRGVKRIANRARLAEIYFLLAGIYEKDSPYRDFKKSREYYTIVRDQYPESSYAPDSKEKIDYLNRHFFFLW